MFRIQFISFAFLLAVGLTQPLCAQLRDCGNDPIVPGGPPIRVAIEEFCKAQVFPARVEYKGIGANRDNVIAERVQTNDRGGYWISVRARYSGRVLNQKVGAERVYVHYDNGGVRADLGGIKGILNTRALGDWIQASLPKRPVVQGGSSGGPPPGPTHVSNGLPSTAPGQRYRTQGSEFEFQRGGVVVERRFNGPSSRFEVTEVGPGFVDLFDKDRNMFVRLTNNRGLWRPANGGEWHAWPGSEGGWVNR